jgi:MFS family permease
LRPAVWALGLVSLFMDISSEMIHGLLPVFLTSVLSAGMETVGLIEGVGEATASISKLFSGWLSDRLGKRKVLAVIGYGLAALSKPLFAIASTSSFVLAARFSDRIGKGSVTHPATLSSAIWCARANAALPTDCGSHWTPSAASRARCWPSR